MSDSDQNQEAVQPLEKQKRNIPWRKTTGILLTLVGLSVALLWALKTPTAIKFKDLMAIFTTDFSEWGPFLFWGIVCGLGGVGIAQTLLGLVYKNSFLGSIINTIGLLIVSLGGMLVVGNLRAQYPQLQTIGGSITTYILWSALLALAIGALWWTWHNYRKRQAARLDSRWSNLHKLEKDWQPAVDKLNKDFRQLKEDQSKLAQAEGQLAAAQEELKVGQARLEQRQDALKEREQAIQAEKARQADKRAELDRWEERLERKEAQLHTQGGELSALQDTLTERQAELDQRQAELNEREAEQEQRQTALDKLQEELDAQQAQHAAEAEKLKEWSRENIAQQRNNETKQAALDKLKKELNDQQAEQDEREAKQEQRQTELEQRQDELEQRQAELNTQQKELYDQQVALDELKATLAERQQLMGTFVSGLLQAGGIAPEGATQGDLGNAFFKALAQTQGKPEMQEETESEPAPAPDPESGDDET